jgi:hypothetical protein
MPLLTRGCVVVAASLSIAASAAAQRQIVRPPTGPLYRYNGDTIWVERDSSITRVVYHGDTITRVSWVNDAVRSTHVYAVNGETARTVDSRDGAGVQRAEEINRTVPTRIATSEREFLQTSLRNASMTSSARNMPVARADEPTTYIVSYSVSLVQHLDTVFHVRGCLGRARLDTTTFVFRGDTAVERLAPRRMFGAGMAYTLTTTMFNANVQKSLASRGTRTNIPARPHDCAAATPPPLTGDRALYYIGSVIRFHNDTIWRERDSTLSRVVFRGDTIQQSSSINGRGTLATYVIDGDSARTLSFINMDGSPRTQSIGQTIPSMMILSDRRMIESQISMAEMQARLPTPMPNGPVVVDGLSNPVPRPASPGTTVTYDPAPDVRMLHLGDTVRYIRGCAPRTPVDTTVFVFVGADSVKRLNPARTFGRGMVASLVGQMQMTDLRQSIAARDPEPAGLPRAPDLQQQCKR